MTAARSLRAGLVPDDLDLGGVRETRLVPEAGLERVIPGDDLVLAGGVGDDPPRDGPREDLGVARALGQTKPTALFRVPCLVFRIEAATRIGSQRERISSMKVSARGSRDCPSQKIACLRTSGLRFVRATRMSSVTA